MTLNQALRIVESFTEFSCGSAGAVRVKPLVMSRLTRREKTTLAILLFAALHCSWKAKVSWFHQRSQCVYNSHAFSVDLEQLQGTTTGFGTISVLRLELEISCGTDCGISLDAGVDRRVWWTKVNNLLWVWHSRIRKNSISLLLHQCFTDHLVQAEVFSSLHDEITTYAAKEGTGLDYEALVQYTVMLRCVNSSISSDCRGPFDISLHPNPRRAWHS